MACAPASATPLRRGRRRSRRVRCAPPFLSLAPRSGERVARGARRVRGFWLLAIAPHPPPSLTLARHLLPASGEKDKERSFLQHAHRAPGEPRFDVVDHLRVVDLVALLADI